MDTDKRNKNRTNSKPPTLPTVQEEKSAPLDDAQTVEILSNRIARAIEVYQVAPLEVLLDCVTICQRATMGWHLERAKSLAAGTVTL